MMLMYFDDDAAQVRFSELPYDFMNNHADHRPLKWHARQRVINGE